MHRFILFTLLLTVIPFQLAYLYARNDNKGSVAGVQRVIPEEIVNWAAIGDYRFTLYGYTSPYARVYFNGQGIHDQTVSDSTGYFEFANRFSPFSPREACLNSVDQLGRLSSPVCLPPFPVKYIVSIGPVLVPPTISLNEPAYYIGDQITLSGQSIPDSEIKLSVFTGPASTSNFLTRIYHLPSSVLSIVKPVEAFSFPDLTTKSDGKGNFSISLPSSNPLAYRLFAQTSRDKSDSGESVRLNLSVYPIWMVVVRFFMLLFQALKARLLEVIIAGEIVYLAFYLLKLWGYLPKKSHFLMLRPNEALTIRQSSDSIIPYAKNGTLIRYLDYPKDLLLTKD